AASGCDDRATSYIGADWPAAACEVTPAAPPAALRADPFYAKYLDANGIPVLASARPADSALQQACRIVVHVTGARDDVRGAMAAAGMRVAVIARDEHTTSIPEHRDLYTAFPGTDWDATTRGVGATRARPVSSCGEENLLCLT